MREPYLWELNPKDNVSGTEVMNNFPNIKPNQVALLYADRNTGIILNRNFKYNINSNELEFTIFNSKIEADIFCKKIVELNPSIECNIYNDTKEHICRIDITTLTKQNPTTNL